MPRAQNRPHDEIAGNRSPRHPLVSFKMEPAPERGRGGRLALAALAPPSRAQAAPELRSRHLTGQRSRSQRVRVPPTARAPTPSPSRPSNGGNSGASPKAPSSARRRTRPGRGAAAQEVLVFARGDARHCRKNPRLVHVCFHKKRKLYIGNRVRLVICNFYSRDRVIFVPCP